MVTRTDGPDPRFGMQAPLIRNLTVRLPSNLQSTLTQSRTITQMTGQTVTGIVDTVRINAQPFVTAFDGNAKRYTSTTAEGRRTFVNVDNKGNVTVDSIPGFAAVKYSYDSKGRLTQSQQGGRVSSFSYNPEGHLSSVVDPLGHATNFFYDAVGRVTRQVLPDSREILYTYDANGNLTSLTPPGRSPHQFDYTPIDLTSSYTPPDSGIGPTVTSYSYNLEGEVTRITRPDGSFINIEYGAGGCGCASLVGLPKAVAFDRGTLTFAYDTTKGLLKTITAPGGNALNYTYDGSLPKRETWSGEVNGNVEVSYDNDFRIISQSVNGGNTVTFSYDKDGLLKSTGSLKLARDASNGLLKWDTLGNISTSYSYNSFGNLSQMTYRNGSTILYDVAYTRDSLNRISRQTETIAGQTNAFTYRYDKSGRLVEVQRNDTTISIYSYDSNGNRLSHITLTGTVTGIYDAQDRLVTYGNANYLYTPNGELRTKIEGIDTTLYSYDAFGNLISVRLPDGTLNEYVIDGQNRRIGRKVNGVFVQRFIYDGQLRPAAELDSTGNITARYVYAEKPNVPEYIIKGGITYRVITDHLGSPRIIIDVSTGVMIQRVDYDEFGNVLFDSNPGYSPFGFAGGVYDHQTKLMRFGARDYDARVGRWTAKVRILFEGGEENLLVYAGNEPLNMLDPSGTIGWSSLMSNTVAANAASFAIGAGFSAFEAWAGGCSEWWEIGLAALGGGVAGRIGGAGSTTVRTFLTGTLAGGGGNLIGQLVGSRGDWGKVDPLEVFYSSIAGGGLALYGKAVTSRAGLRLNRGTLVGMTIGLGIASGLVDMMIHHRVQQLRRGF